MQEFINEYVLSHIGAFVGAGFTALAGFLFGKKKMEAEIEAIDAENDAKQIDNAVRTLKYYQELTDDLGKKLTIAVAELNEAKKTIKELENKVEELTDELKKYKHLKKY